MIADAEATINNYLICLGYIFFSYPSVNKKHTENLNKIFSSVFYEF